jgi:hypothetical protein
VWIGIPAKSLLLDSVHGHQLANECKTDDPSAPVSVQTPAAPATTTATAPAPAAPVAQ